jgi:predicted DCC family thiol-disulfide oxidoreductase YuxK
MAAATVAADPAPGTGIVLYDGDCPLCQRSVAVVKKLDWLGRLAYGNAREDRNLPPSAVPLDPQRLLEEMHLVTPDRRHAYAGFRAFRWIAWRLPATWLLAPFLYLPGVPWLGNRIYRWIAKNRFGLVPCRDGVCHIPIKKG